MSTSVIADQKGLTGIDLCLLLAFFLGNYSGLTLQLSAAIPVPDTLAGVAGMFMLIRQRDRISPEATAALAVAVAIYLLATLAAPDLHFLAKRFTGLLQLIYSLVICYSLFLTLTGGTPRQLAGVFLAFSLVLLVGALAEQYLGLRPFSDAVRARIYSDEILYVSDARDLLFYGRIRPKLFGSEPAGLTFHYTLFSFVWLVLSNWRWKVPVYLGIFFPVGLFVMPGPTLLMMLVLLVPYHLFGPSAEGSPRTMAARLVETLILICVLTSVLGAIAVTEFSTRLNELMNGQDSSFFYREMGPALVAKSVFLHHPLTGAGLTGESYLQDEVLNVFANSSGYSNDWSFEEVKHMLTNYFWLHWIYLGPVFGIAVLIGLNAWLKRIGVSSLPFCWAIWIIMGQTSGGYVAPNTWMVLMLGAAIGVILDRPQESENAPSIAWGGWSQSSVLAFSELRSNDMRKRPLSKLYAFKIFEPG